MKMQEIIGRLSNEMLEHEISTYYWVGAKNNPGWRVPEEGVLADLWAEFDARVQDKRIGIV